MLGTIEGIKGALTARGGLGARAAGGAAGAWKGVQTPIKSVIQGLKAQRALRRVAAAPKPTSLTESEFHTLREVLDRVPAKGLLSIQAPKMRGGPLEQVGRKAEAAGVKAVKKQLKVEAKGLTKRPRRGEKLTDWAETSVLNPAEVGAAKGRVLGAGRDAAYATSFREVKGLLSRAAKNELPMSPALARSLLPEARAAYAQGVAQLGLGGLVGSAGAYIQYGRGRALAKALAEK
tara:strand:- start:202 stop:903 length:702 start_codon:yes stop_codon:yes gene_type:complete